jgi:hypothetical protein
MPTRIHTLFAALLVFCFSPPLPTILAQPAAPAKAPPKAPEELLTREVLEKLYTAEIPGYQVADFEKLYAAHVLLEKYFLTDSAEDRQTITKLLVQSGADAAVLGRMCRIHLGWPALPGGPAYVNERIGPHDVQYFMGIPAGYDRGKAWPLVIRLIAANALIADPEHPPKPDDVVRMYAGWAAEEAKAHPDAVVVMPLLNLDEMYGPSYKGMNSVIQAMHHVTTKVNVDASRVYMVGHGMGAHATWNLSIHYPTYFAAINPLAGAASQDWQRIRLMNLRNTLPVVWHDTDDPIIKTGHATALVNILKNLKYEVVFEQTQKMGHVPSEAVAAKLYETMRGRTRELYPKQVNVRSSRPDPTFNRVDWVQLYQPLNAGQEISFFLRRGTGKILLNQNAFSCQAALTGPNKVEAKTDNVETMRVYLNDQMMDLTKPVTVIVNGKTRFEGMIKPSIEEMLKDQVFLGRGWRYFTAAIDVDLSPSSTKPTTRVAAAAIRPAATQATHFYFTTDEGKTLFIAPASSRTPFQHEGKIACRAHVFSCDGGKTNFVGYLSKNSAIAGEDLIRRPGEERWFPISSPGAAVMMGVKCPEGGGGKVPVEVFPKEKPEAGSQKPE